MIYWKLYKNGHYTGIDEYDYVYASNFWGTLAQLSRTLDGMGGTIYQLKPVTVTLGGYDERII